MKREKKIEKINVKNQFMGEISKVKKKNQFVSEIEEK